MKYIVYNKNILKKNLYNLNETISQLAL